jgi:hypothetical protein
MPGVVPCLDASYKVQQFDSSFRGLSKTVDRPASAAARRRSTSPCTRSDSPSPITWAPSPGGERQAPASRARPPVSPSPFAVAGSTAAGTNVAASVGKKKVDAFSVLGNARRPLYADDRGAPSVFSVLQDNVLPAAKAKKHCDNDTQKSVLFNSPIDERLKQRFDVKGYCKAVGPPAKNNVETTQNMQVSARFGKRCPSPPARSVSSDAGPTVPGKRTSTPERVASRAYAGGYWQSKETVVPLAKVDAAYKIAVPWIHSGAIAGPKPRTQSKKAFR